MQKSLSGVNRKPKLSAIFERSITMAITNYEEMSITSPAFNTVREAFDVALQRLLKKMEKSKMVDSTPLQ